MSDHDVDPAADSWKEDVNAPIEAEIGLLGAALLDDTGEAAKVLFGLPTEDFSHPHAAAVALAMAASMNGHPSPDPIEVATALRRAGETTALKFLRDKVFEHPTGANAPLYAERIRFFAARRRETKLRRKLASAEGATAQDRARQELDAFLTLEAEDAAAAATLPEAEDFFVTSTGPEPPAPVMLVDRLFVRDSLNLVFGPPASGKSWLLMSLCYDAVTTGGTLLGSEELTIHLPEDGRPEVVLWIYGTEDNRARILRRLKKLHRGGDMNFPLREGSLYYQTPPDGLLLNSADGWHWLKQLLERYRPTILVLDTIASLTASTLDVNKAEEVVPFMQKLLAIRTRHKVTIFAGHHTSKPAKDAGRTVASKAASMLGSQAWLSMTEGCFMVEAKDGDTSDVKFHCVKTKDVENPIPTLRLCLDRDTGRFRMLRDDEEAPIREVVSQREPTGRPSKFSPEAVLATREKYPDGLGWNETMIREALGISRSLWMDRRDIVGTELIAKGCVFINGSLKWPPAEPVQKPLF